jgi:hypothetical protein
VNNSGTRPPGEEQDQQLADQSLTLPPSDPEESTVGTGTFFALGCTAATVVLILIGILIILLLR